MKVGTRKRITNPIWREIYSDLAYLSRVAFRSRWLDWEQPREWQIDHTLTDCSQTFLE